MLENLKDVLVQKGISPSFHRIKIYEYLMNNRTHPTAEMIYADMIQQIPTLSKTTIYNTLKTFSQKGIVSSITIEDNEVRFDADTKFHGHFKCTVCGNLYDVFREDFNNDSIESVVKDISLDHEISDCHIYFKGTCKNCKNI